MVKRRGPGRPRVRAMEYEVGLTEVGALALKWLVRRGGAQSKSGCVNEALVRYAQTLGWRPPAEKAGG